MVERIKMKKASRDYNLEQQQQKIVSILIILKKKIGIEARYGTIGELDMNGVFVFKLQL
jgi:hypothetical protein